MAIERAPARRRVRSPYHVMLKAVGPLCNLDCSYCYYLEKESRYPPGERMRMDDALLERFVASYVASHPGDTVIFPWHGGEPMLAGVDFYRRAVELQRRLVPPGWKFVNVLQTNGTLIDEPWADFLREAGFNVAISVDGPARMHDAHRPDRSGRGSHERAVRGMRLLQERAVPFSVMCTVNDANAGSPLEVYRYFRGLGVEAMQFLPIVKREGDGVSPETVGARDYGEFLVTIFEEWARCDVGAVWVQLFDDCMRKLRGEPGALCLYRETCGDSLVVEHDGEIFACDHFVTDEWRLGNVRELPMKVLVESPRMKRFAQAKRDALPAHCRRCDVLEFCRGGCPKDRFLAAPDGEPGLNYLCEGYRRFFRHARDRLAELFPGDVARPKAGPPPGRNDACPCGSGEKYKRCCGKDGARPRAP